MALDISLPFVWGKGGSRLTPEELARQRAYEAQILARGVDTSPAASNMEGLARVANALVGSFRRGALDRAEQQNRDEDAALAAPLAHALSASYGLPSSTVPMPGAAGEAAATSPRAATIPQTADAEYIRNGLIKRGFSPQVSDAFLANFQDESGLNPGINEANPIVPGSRGGFGLYQLTGPRRTAYEAFANERGVPLNDVDAQLDFLKYETEGPEAKAASTFLNAPDTATAAQAIVNNFLRPAQEHRTARAAAYAGLPTVQTAPVTPVEVASLNAPQTATDAIEAQAPLAYAAPPPPMTAARNQPQAAPPLPPPTTVADAPAVAAVPQQVAQAQLPQAPQLPSVPPQVLAQAIQAAQSPYASERTKSIANALIKRQQDFQQAQQQQQQFLFEQQYKAAQEAADPMRQAQLQKLNQEIAAGADRTPESVRALQERARLSGLQEGTPEYNAFIQTGGSRTPQTLAPPPTGYQYNYDGNGNVVSVSPIPGSPAALEMEQALRTKETQGGRRETATDVITNAASEARNLIRNGTFTTGTLGRLAANLSESDAAELRRQIDVLTSNATIENLTAMRQASPTGGALGSVTEREGAMLAAAAGAIDPNSGKERLEKQLDNYEHTLLRVIHGPKVGDAIFEQTRQTQPAVIDGYQIEEVTE
ncbi:MULTISPECIES: phage tail tip lysozyme [unclassified Sinorhizobium]|uniref:phage tail tip lysozyme n=1 Tax=unclassified Sinorhizobium TaxID=2613772 RepID=UPI003524F8AD